MLLKGAFSPCLGPLRRPVSKTANLNQRVSFPVVARAVTQVEPWVRRPGSAHGSSHVSKDTTSAPRPSKQGTPVHERAEFVDAYQAPKPDFPGVARAVGLVAMWALVFKHAVFQYDLSAAATLPHILDGIVTFAVMEFLSTGLFITTHDAMHSAVAPNNTLLNDTLGSLCISLYAWFDYKKMHKKHWEHHNECGTPHKDPDFHTGNPNLPAWFSGFMLSYASLPQFAKLQAISMALMYFGAPMPNLMLFWTGSGLLSALRLFYFGTYQPHKPDAAAWEEGGSGQMPWDKARSSSAVIWLSFLRCYHFDYHWEHHRWPTAPWWDLPQAKSAKDSAFASLAGMPSPAATPSKRQQQQQQQQGAEELGPGFAAVSRSLSRSLSNALESASSLKFASSLRSMGSLELACASMDA